MTQQEFDAMIKEVLSYGIEITMFMEFDPEVIWYDVNTGMKSDLFIAYIDGICVFQASYNREGVISYFDDLVYEVRNCLCGRDYGNEGWLELINAKYY